MRPFALFLLFSCGLAHAEGDWASYSSDDLLRRRTSITEITETAGHADSRLPPCEGIDSISDAEKYHGCEVRVPASERAELEPGEYFHSDLIGCEVIDLASGNSIGKVTALQDAGGGGLLVVEGDILVPFATGLCKLIDIEKRRIEVQLPDGLLELNRP